MNIKRHRPVIGRCLSMYTHVTRPQFIWGACGTYEINYKLLFSSHAVTLLFCLRRVRDSEKVCASSRILGISMPALHNLHSVPEAGFQ